MSESTIRFQQIGATWETLGAGRYAKVVAQNIEATSNEWGNDQLTFTIQTQRGAPRPDLLPYTPVLYEEGGKLVWSGRVKAKPAGEREIAVSCEGWQYHLDDDVFFKMYVQNRMSDLWYSVGGTDYVTAGPRWTDLRAGVNTTDSTYATSYTVEAKGGMRLALPIGAVAGNNTRGAVVFDAGEGQTIARFTITYKGGGNADLALNYETSTNFDGAGDGATNIDAAPIATGSTTTSITPANARRYLRIGIQNTSGASSTGTSASWARILDVICYADAGYESGNASVLVSSTVIAHALARAPLLNQTTTSITAGTFALPEYSTDGYVTPRTVMDGVNAYENYDLKIGGPDLKTLVYRVRPTAPIFDVGNSDGATFADDSASGESIYTRCIVQGSDAADRNLTVTRTQTGTVVDRRGFDRAFVLNVRSVLKTATANQLGDKFLADHATIPLSGKITGTGAFVRQAIGGATVPPAAMLLHCGEKIRLSHRRDPDTGDQGRDGRIVGVSYRPADDSLTIDVDDRRTSFDRALARREIRAR